MKRTLFVGKFQTSEIRNLIIKRKEWQHLLPEDSRDLLLKIKGVQRLRLFN